MRFLVNRVLLTTKIVTTIRYVDTACYVYTVEDGWGWVVGSYSRVRTTQLCNTILWNHNMFHIIHQNKWLLFRETYLCLYKGIV